VGSVPATLENVLASLPTTLEKSVANWPAPLLNQRLTVNCSFLRHCALVTYFVRKRAPEFSVSGKKSYQDRSDHNDVTSVCLLAGLDQSEKNH
jgi:hypothetical protein